MDNNLFYDFSYVIGNDFIYKNKIEVKVFFVYQKAHAIPLSLMLKKVKGKNETYYLNEAKKIINKMIKNGSLKQYCEKHIKLENRKKRLCFLWAPLCLLALVGIVVGTCYACHQTPVTPRPITYSISMVTDGATISPTTFIPTEEKYEGTISVTATGKILDGDPTITLEKSGTDITDSCTYTPEADNKSAQLTIEKQYITDNIKVEVTLVDEPIYHISMVTDGTSIEEEVLPTTEDYVGTISVTNEDKILDGLTLVTLKDGDDTDITNYCDYEEEDDKTASLEIPLAYLTNDIEVTVALTDIDPHRKEELTFTCVEAGSLGINYHSFCAAEATPEERDINVSYKIDNGDWEELNIEQHFDPGVDDGYNQEYMFSQVSLTEGQKIHVRGDNDYWSYRYEGEYVYEEYLTFISKNGGKFSVSNNVMSLLSSDNFAALNDATDFGFANLFGITVAPGDIYKGANISSASSLYLPTNLADTCFDSMFIGNANLAEAPKLPATTLEYSCYSYMFDGCAALEEAPDLPAETLTDYCYWSMFSNCTSLVSAPELNATELAYDCYEDMFNGCTSLEEAPDLPAETLEEYCYYRMFKGCTSLTVLPELNATELMDGCYYEMFSGCTAVLVYDTLVGNLIFTCPEIPEEAYTNPVENMFEGISGSPTPVAGTTYYYVVNPNP